MRLIQVFCEAMDAKSYIDGCALRPTVITSPVTRWPCDFVCAGIAVFLCRAICWQSRRSRDDAPSHLPSVEGAPDKQTSYFLFATRLQLSSTPILLKANNVGRSEPAILAGPRLRRVFTAIFLRDCPLPEEIVVILLLFGVHDHAPW
jgi:hypothetical protein